MMRGISLEPGELHEDMVIKFSRPFVKNVLPCNMLWSKSMRI
jgi:hypothetical protein